MKDHFVLNTPDYVAPKVLPFFKIAPWNFSALVNAGYRDYRDIIIPTSLIPKFVFRGFEKAWHFEYKFDSKAEQNLAYVFQHDSSVIKWLRSAPNQFRTYWDNNSRQQEPDFVAETGDSIYMIEPKSASELQAPNLLAKKAAAEKFCKYASDFTAQNGCKAWKYILVPHNEITRTISLKYLITKFN